MYGIIRGNENDNLNDFLNREIGNSRNETPQKDLSNEFCAPWMCQDCEHSDCNKFVKR